MSQVVATGKRSPAAGRSVGPVAKERCRELLVKDDALYVSGETKGVPLEWLLDTGSSRSLLSEDVYMRIPQASRPELVACVGGLKMVDGDQLSALGRAKFVVQVDKTEYVHEFIVACTTDDGILGMDFLREHGGLIDLAHDRFTLNGQRVHTQGGLSLDRCYRVALAEPVTLPAGHRKVVMGKVPAGVLPKGEWMVEGLSRPPGGKCVMVGRSVVRGCSGKVQVEMLNPSEEDVVLNKNTHVARLGRWRQNHQWGMRGMARGSMRAAAGLPVLLFPRS